MMLIDFSTPCLKYGLGTPPSIWGLGEDCPVNFENGKFMLPLGELVEEEWLDRRFLWYMHASKLGMKEFVVKAPKEYFHLEEDCDFIVDFHDMHRLLRCKDLDVAQVTLFAL